MKERARRNTGGRRRDDSGFSLTEVSVALLVFAMLSTSVAGMLLQSLQTSRSNKARVTAANLAARELEIVRSQFSSPAAGPRTVQVGRVLNANPLTGGAAGDPLVLDNLAYTVTRESQWQSQDASSGACDGGASGQLSYLRVTVEVTWPKMGSTQPVTTSTLMTPPAGTYAAGSGHIKVKVVDQDNVPQADQQVTLTGPTGTGGQQTAADGCAFFAFLPVGTFTVGVAKAGYVDPTWNPTPSSSVTVTANTVSSAGFTYAPASRLTLSVPSPMDGYPVAPNTPVTVYNTAFLTSTQTMTLPTDGSSSVTRSVWPYPDGLVAWSGSCLDADPRFHAGSRAQPLSTPPGAVATGTAVTVPLAVTVRRADNTPVVGARLVATHAADAGCPGPVTDPVDSRPVGQVVVAPGVGDVAGLVRLALPYGTWTLKVAGERSVGPDWLTVVVTPTTAAPAVTPLVVR